MNNKAIYLNKQYKMMTGAMKEEAMVSRLRIKGRMGWISQGEEAREDISEMTSEQRFMDEKEIDIGRPGEVTVNRKEKDNVKALRNKNSVFDSLKEDRLDLEVV